MSVAFVGHDAAAAYMVRCLFGENASVEAGRTIFIGGLRGAVARMATDHDLVVTHLHGSYLKHYFDESFVRIPSFVRQKLDLPAVLEDLPSAIKTRGSQKDMNKVRRNGFTWEVTRDPETFRRFYEEFHRPFIAARHGSIDAHIESYEKLLPILEEGELLMVKRGGEHVSGVLCRRRGEVYETICAGVHRADPELVKEGALAAEYLFSMERGIQLGCSVIDFGPTRPFVNDGILQFKKKWNAKTCLDERSIREIGLHFCSASPPVARFLENNPFISLHGDHLQANVFVGDQQERTVEEMGAVISNSNLIGLSAIRLVLLSREWIDRQEELRRTFAGKYGIAVTIVPCESISEPSELLPN